MSIGNRIPDCFMALKKDNRAGLIAFITAGDPDLENSKNILNALPDAGVDIIELGMPFSDPMADGKVIQESYKRSLKGGHTLVKTINMVREFRLNNTKTPIILMGYYNPIYNMGVDKFIEQISEAGVDGLIIVDLPPEADDELCIPAKNKNISFIRLTSPTTNVHRLSKIKINSSGFIYYVSITGITGAKTGNINNVIENTEKIKSIINLPVAVGFGINTPKKAGDLAKFSDAVVVGSSLISEIFKASSMDYDIVNHLKSIISDYVKEIKLARK